MRRIKTATLQDSHTLVPSCRLGAAPAGLQCTTRVANTSKDGYTNSLSSFDVVNPSNVKGDLCAAIVFTDVSGIRIGVVRRIKTATLQDSHPGAIMQAWCCTSRPSVHDTRGQHE